MDFAKDWSADDTAGLLAMLGSTAADIDSTKQVFKQPGAFEQNPLIGKHPSGANLDTAGIVAGTITGGAAALAPSGTRGNILDAATAVHTLAALNNYNQAGTQNDPKNIATLATLGLLLGSKYLPKGVTPYVGPQRGFGVNFEKKF
ncbi:MAG: hypothetical protein KGL39_06995 [Patescibacteria group bacterium]|nr:hypothetical protein [Patescibacteria group bacterium]